MIINPIRKITLENEYNNSLIIYKILYIDINISKEYIEIPRSIELL